MTRDIVHVDKDLLKEDTDGLCSRYGRYPIGDMAEVGIVFEGLDVEEITGVGLFLDLLG